jgi:IS30 family transposase
MQRKRKCLTLELRQSIWMMRSLGNGIRDIGRLLKLDPSIVSRELKRNSLPVYIASRLTPLERAKEAHDKAKRRRQEKRRGKRKAEPSLLVYEHITQKLMDKWSPEDISATISDTFPGLKLSTTTIYRMIKRDAPELKQYLFEKGKPRRQCVMNRRGRFQQAAAAEKRHVSERPKEAEERKEVGHLEADMILSRRGSKAAILSIYDRASRRRWYLHVANLEAATVRKALVRFLHTLPAYARKTLTLDRGSEFAEWDMIEKIFPDLKVYFCTAYSPHEKGGVERSNRDLRRFYPKGTDFALVSQEQLSDAQGKINRRPMKCLGRKTSADYHEHLLNQANESELRNAA